MRIAIAGASGMIGHALMAYWGQLGHSIHRLVRDEPGESTDIPWEPSLGRLVPAQMEGFDAVVCLSGAGIADARWTPARKEVLRNSRVDTVSTVAKALAACTDKPECLICASAVGIYGADRGMEVLSEDSDPGTDFLGTLCSEWEAAADPARAAEIRVVHLRFGIVLSGDGGALKRMLPVFKLGLGGKLGSGRQMMSWVTLDDVVNAADFILQAEALEGPVNVASPHPVSNEALSKALGRVLRRPAFARVPEFVLRTAMGESADLLLGSVRVFPRRLEEAGFRFRTPDIESALSSALK